MFHSYENQTPKSPHLKGNFKKLIGIEEAFISDSAISKDAIFLCIHNQLHIIGYNKNKLLENIKAFTGDIVKHRILKVDFQISKLWVLNDYNVIMIQYYDQNGLYIYKITNQFKELKFLSKVILKLYRLIINRLNWMKLRDLYH